MLGARVEKEQADIGLYQLRFGTSFMAASAAVGAMAVLIDLVPVGSALGASGGAAPTKHGRNVDHVALRVLPRDGEAILCRLREHGI